MQAHLTKPLRLRDLENALKTWTKPAAPRLARASSQMDEIGDLKPELLALFADRKKRALTLVNQLIAHGRLEGTTLDQLASELHQIAGVASFFDEEDLGSISRALERDLADGTAGDQSLLLSVRDALVA